MEEYGESFEIVLCGGGAGGSEGAGTGTGSVKPNSSMWLCSHIMRREREMHPTILSTLEGFVEQVNSIFLSVISFFSMNTRKKVIYLLLLFSLSALDELVSGELV